MADDNKNLSYEELRKEVIKKYRVLYKDALAMDICNVPKDIRIRMLEDPEYIAETKAIKAHLFVEQLETLDNVLAENYNHSDKGTDVSGVILKALEMKQKLLLEDLNINKDESNALNVTFVAMTREDFDTLETVEIKEGGNSDELGADFGATDDMDSFEARQKAKIQEKLKELDNNSNTN